MACQICSCYWYSQRNYRLCSLDWSLGFSLSEILIVNELTRSVLFLYFTPSICSRKTFYFIMRAFVLCIFNWNLNFTAVFEFNCNSFMGVIICQQILTHVTLQHLFWESLFPCWSHYFLVTSDWVSCFFLVWYGWGSYYFEESLFTAILELRQCENFEIFFNVVITFFLEPTRMNAILMVY